MQPIDAKERLIVALDVFTQKEAEDIVEKLDGLVSFYKIGIILNMASGLKFVEWLIERGKKVFLDLKYFDVQDTIKEAVKQVANIGVTFLTVHGNGKTIQAAMEGRGESDLKILSVTVLTSLDAYDIQDLGFTACNVEDLVLFRAKKAMEAGCDGIIASVKEVKLIREKIGNKLLIVTPGIRPEGVDIDDHKRFAPPAEAIEEGADYLVVGRPIIKAKDPCKAAENIIKEMDEAFQEKEKASLKKEDFCYIH